MKFETSRRPLETTKAEVMHIGDMAIIENGTRAGDTILRTFDGVVSLNHPRSTWNLASLPYLNVTLLAPGDSVTLTQE
jgi:hypothetical protein